MVTPGISVLLISPPCVPPVDTRPSDTSVAQLATGRLKATV
ncbi:MAG: hypothetical protein WD649_02685 [Thermoleophilaceae bacterium]